MLRIFLILQRLRSCGIPVAKGRLEWRDSHKLTKIAAAFSYYGVYKTSHHKRKQLEEVKK